MNISDELNQLADLLDQIDTPTVTDVSVRTANDESGATAEVALELPLLDVPTDENAPTIKTTQTELGESGTLTLGLAVAFPPRPTQERSRADEAAAEESANIPLSDGGEHSEIASADERIASDSTTSSNTEETTAETDPADDTAESSECDTLVDETNTNLPAYQDPDLLAAVYEAHETFAEMTDALNVDVTAQTVRRYMIKYGIHETSSDDADTEATTGTEVSTNALTEDRSASSPSDDDEIQQEGTNGPEVDERILPNHLSLEDVKEAVRNGQTLLEVQRTLDIEREEARALLDELNLLELVVGRVSTVSDQPTPTAEIERRIQRAT